MLDILGIFMAVLLAEMGDKTQLATVAAASRGTHSPYVVFAAAAGALVVSSGVAVLAGHYFGKTFENLPLKLIAGAIFIALGLWSVVEHFRGA